MSIHVKRPRYNSSLCNQYTQEFLFSEIPYYSFLLTKYQKNDPRQNIDQMDKRIEISKTKPSFDAGQS